MIANISVNPNAKLVITLVTPQVDTITRESKTVTMVIKVEKITTHSKRASTKP